VTDISSSLFSTIIMIAGAVIGLGVMALVIGRVSFYGLRSLQYFIRGWNRWRPELHFDIRDVSGYIGFGLYQMGERTVTYLSINIINLIIGRYLGPGALGHYSLAYQLTITPLLRANTVLMQVSFPIFFRFQHVNGLLQGGYLHMTRLISFTMFPVLLLTFLIAPVFVPLLLGAQWSDVIPLVQILAIVGALRALGAPTVPAYLAKGRADIGFTWNFILAIINGIVFYIMTGYGLIALTWPFAAISFLQFVLLQTITGNMISLKWIDFLRAFSMNLLRSAIMGLVVYGIYLAGISLKMGNPELFVAMLTAGLITYFAITWTFSRQHFAELWGFLRPGRS
jgi:O-antigen/teichoic acid export membrane protein